MGNFQMSRRQTQECVQVARDAHKWLAALNRFFCAIWHRAGSPKETRVASTEIEMAQMVVEQQRKFKGNFLCWPIRRASRAFRVYVVEPSNYRPDEHAKIFSQALMLLIAPTPELVSLYPPSHRPLEPQPFDLITFPEAFLPSGELLKMLRGMPRLATIGCVHVGLRPSEADEHLFLVSELRALVQSLRICDRSRSERSSRFLPMARRSTGRPTIQCRVPFYD